MGLPFLSPGDLPNAGIERESSALQADSLTELQGKPVKSLKIVKSHTKYTYISIYICNGIYIAELKCLFLFLLFHLLAEVIL